MHKGRGRGEGTLRGGADQTVTLAAIFGPKIQSQKNWRCIWWALIKLMSKSFSKSLESFPFHCMVCCLIYICMYEMHVERLQYHNTKHNEWVNEYSHGNRCSYSITPPRVCESNFFLSLASLASNQNYLTQWVCCKDFKQFQGSFTTLSWQNAKKFHFEGVGRWVCQKWNFWIFILHLVYNRSNYLTTFLSKNITCVADDYWSTLVIKKATSKGVPSPLNVIRLEIIDLYRAWDPGTVGVWGAWDRLGFRAQGKGSGGILRRR